MVVGMNWQGCNRGLTHGDILWVWFFRCQVRILLNLVQGVQNGNGAEWSMLIRQSVQVCWWDTIDQQVQDRFDVAECHMLTSSKVLMIAV